MDDDSSPPISDYRAVAELHHRMTTGLILSLMTHKGEEVAADVVYRLFRRQHSETFLPGLEKLGLTGLPDAVASAQYHYLSNAIGTVKVEYMPESDRKAWIRYPPPRWIFDGTAICGVTNAVTIAMMRGWHAHNGEALENPNLGFVCTGMTTDGDPGLEGYFYDYDAPLAPEDRLRFAPDEEAPVFNADTAPTVDAADWPALRLAKAERNYALYYVRSMFGVLLDVFDATEAAALVHLTARLIGMQFYDATRDMLGLTDPSREGFADYLERMSRAMGNGPVRKNEGGAIVIANENWRLMEPRQPELLRAWNGIWEGACAVHDRSLAFEFEDGSGSEWCWRLPD